MKAGGSTAFPLDATDPIFNGFQNLATAVTIFQRRNTRDTGEQSAPQITLEDAVESLSNI